MRPENVHGYLLWLSCRSQQTFQTNETCEALKECYLMRNIPKRFTREEVKGFFNFPLRWPTHQEEKGDRSVQIRWSVEINKLITKKIVPFGSSVTALIISNLYFSVQATPKIVPL